MRGYAYVMSTTSFGSQCRSDEVRCTSDLHCLHLRPEDFPSQDWIHSCGSGAHPMSTSSPDSHGQSRVERPWVSAHPMCTERRSPVARPPDRARPTCTARVGTHWVSRLRHKLPGRSHPTCTSWNVSQPKDEAHRMCTARVRPQRSSACPKGLCSSAGHTKGVLRLTQAHLSSFWHLARTRLVRRSVRPACWAITSAIQGVDHIGLDAARDGLLASRSAECSHRSS